MKCVYIPETRTVIKSLIGTDGCSLVREHSVEKQNLRGPNLGEDAPHGVAPVQLPEQGAGWHPGQNLRHIGQEVKWVTQQHRLECGNGLHLRSEKT